MCRGYLCTYISYKMYMHVCTYACIYLASNMYTYYVGEYNFSQTDSDNPLLFIGKYLLNQVDSDSHAKEDNKTSEVHT